MIQQGVLIEADSSCSIPLGQKWRGLFQKMIPVALKVLVPETKQILVPEHIKQSFFYCDHNGQNFQTIGRSEIESVCEQLSQ